MRKPFLIVTRSTLRLRSQWAQILYWMAGTKASSSTRVQPTPSHVTYGCEVEHYVHTRKVSVRARAHINDTMVKERPLHRDLDAQFHTHSHYARICCRHTALSCRTRWCIASRRPLSPHGRLFLVNVVKQYVGERWNIPVASSRATVVLRMRV